MSKILKFLCILSIPLMPSLVVGMQDQLQIVNPNKLLEEYEKLFLDDWQKLVKLGRNKEAVELATKQEQEAIKFLNESLDKNNALTYQEYRESQHRKGLDINEHFSAAYFRIYSANPSKLIENHEKNIIALEAQLNKRNKAIEDLENKKLNAPYQKDVLKNKIDEDYIDINNSINKLIKFEQEFPDLKNILKIKNEIDEVYNLFKRDYKNIDLGIIDYKVTKIKEIQNEISNYFSNFNYSYENKTQEEKKISRVKYEFNLFYGSPVWFMDKIKDWLETDPNARLEKWDERLLENMKQAHKAFVEDTEQKIAKEKERIEFIKKNPSFFKIPARPRSHILGIGDAHQWYGEGHSHKLGDGVIVGIVDGFDTCEQKSRILDKAINPEMVGLGCPLSIGTHIADVGSHGLHVAGIIVSDLPDKNDFPMTLGVAPGAKFEMISYQALYQPEKKGVVLKNVGISGKNERFNWSVENMSAAIHELSQTGKVKNLGVSKDMIQDNPIVNSSASIINWSMTTSELKRFSRLSSEEFEGESEFLVLVKILESKLLVIANGNDGVDLSSTPQHRLKKALAYNSITSPNLILVTNLMEDGLTLNPSSNIPGNEYYLQRRTLSAPGTSIKSTLLMQSEEAEAYGEKSGTSMAAPHVSGVAAVVLSNHPHLTSNQLAECLLEGATPLLINNEGKTVELSNITAGEVNQSFDQSPRAQIIEIKGLKIKREDWDRGQESYGQGRVSLMGALEVLEDKKFDDLT